MCRIPTPTSLDEISTGRRPSPWFGTTGAAGFRTAVAMVPALCAVRWSVSAWPVRESDVMTPTVTDVPERRRFEIDVDGDVVGFAEYERRPGVIAFVHTEVDPSQDGAGVGTQLVTAALDAARAQGLAVLPFCPFVRGFIDRHREYLDLVPVERRAKLGLGDG